MPFEDVFKSVYLEWGFAGLFFLTGWIVFGIFYYRNRNHDKDLIDGSRDAVALIEKKYEAIISEIKESHSSDKKDWISERSQWREEAIKREAIVAEVIEKTTEAMITVAERLRSFENMLNFFPKRHSG